MPWVDEHLQRAWKSSRNCVSAVLNDAMSREIFRKYYSKSIREWNRRCIKCEELDKRKHERQHESEFLFIMRYALTSRVYLLIFAICYGVLWTAQACEQLEGWRRKLNKILRKTFSNFSPDSSPILPVRWNSISVACWQKFSTPVRLWSKIRCLCHLRRLCSSFNSILLCSVILSQTKFHCCRRCSIDNKLSSSLSSSRAMPSRDFFSGSFDTRASRLLFRRRKAQ